MKELKIVYFESLQFGWTVSDRILGEIGIGDVAEAMLPEENLGQWIRVFENTPSL